MLNNYTCTCLDGYNGAYCQNCKYLNIIIKIEFIVKYKIDYSCWNSPCEGCIQIEANSTEYECTCSKFNSLTCKSEIKQPLGISFASVYLNDGRLASSFDDYSIKIFSDILTFKNYSSILTGHTDLIKTLVQLEHDVLASGSCDSTIKLWNLTTMSLIKTLQNHTGSVNALLKVKLDNGQTYLISGSQDSTVNLWFGNKLIKKINNHSEPIKALVYFDKYNYLAIGSQNKIIRLLEFKNYKGKLLKSFKQIHGIYKFAILPNGNLVGSSKTTIKIWNSSSFELISNLFGHSDFIIALAVLPNSNIVSGSLDLTIKIWQSEYPYNCFAILTAHTGGVNALAILPNKNIVSGSWDTTIKIWQSEYPYKLIANLTGHTGKIYALAILPNTNIVSCGSDWTIKIWNSKFFKLITTLYNKESYDVYTLAILPDSNILSGCHDGSLKIWNSTSYKLITTLTGHTDSIIALL